MHLRVEQQLLDARRAVRHLPLPVDVQGLCERENVLDNPRRASDFQ